MVNKDEYKIYDADDDDYTAKLCVYCTWSEDV